MTACLYIHPDAYTTSGPRLMGRNVAGASFLRGFLAHSRADAFFALIDRPEHATVFEEAVAAERPGAAATVLRKRTLGRLAEVGALHVPSPALADDAFRRAMAGGVAGHAAWSLTGITHTTASAPAMDAIAALLVAPLQPWDALICTSEAVKDNVTRILGRQSEHLAERLGATRFVLPRLPVIPLGIHCADFVFSDPERAAARAAVGADGETVVVLFLGRLSFHAKAHPLAMYQAVAGASRATGRRAVVVECGWHPNDAIAHDFAEAAAFACPEARVVTLDGRDAALRRTAWAAADLFCSLSDNIQETFGIAPIEAMAAGLPVVVSDWDGYRETVRDGVEGFRIPTLMPRPGLAGDLAALHALGENYDLYCGYASSLTAVEVGPATLAMTRLFRSPDLRRRMGDAGRRRAREAFDWSAIIPRYEALWDELAEARRAGAYGPRPKPVWPARPDPFEAFQAYPTRQLARETMLALAIPDAPAARAHAEACRALGMVHYAEAVLPTAEETARIISALADGPRAAGELIAFAPRPRQPFLLRGLGALIKQNVLAVGG